MKATLKTAITETQFTAFYNNAIEIKSGGYETTENQELTALTAFNCLDDITVFAIKKIGGKNIGVMGWRFRKESVLDIQLKFHELIESQAVCDLYIIGGHSITTQGENCLLSRIHLAIRDYFTTDAKIIEQHTNLNLNTRFPYLTTNVQINGKLTFCSHMSPVNRK